MFTARYELNYFVCGVCVYIYIYIYIYLYIYIYVITLHN